MPATALALHTDGCISVWQRRTAPAAAAAATVAATASSGSLTPAVSRQPTPFTPGAAEATPRAAKRHGAVSFVFRSMLRLLRGEGLALCAFGAAHPPTPDGFAGLTVDGRLWLWSLPPGAAAATAASAHCWPDEWQLHQRAVLPSLCALLGSLATPLQPPPPPPPHTHALRPPATQSTPRGPCICSVIRPPEARMRPHH